MPVRIPTSARTTAVTALVLLSSVSGRAQELTLGNPAPLSAAQEAAATAELVIGDESEDETEVTAIAEVEVEAVPDSVSDEPRETEIINERYKSGAIKIRREVTQDATGNYILHGEWTMWDEKGNPLAQGTYHDHQRHGAWTRWYYNRKESELFSQAPYNEFELPFKSQANFDNGQLHGTWVITDARNRKVSEWSYVKGQRNGTATWYYPTGHKMEDMTYRDGLIDGHRYRWDKSAKLILDELYIQGRKSAPRIDYFAPNQKKAEGMYLYAQIVVDTPDDWWAAKPVTYRTVGQDVRHGAWTSYFENGRKAQEGRFENDREVGDFTWWYENGQVMTRGTWLEGKRHGLWVWYHENGQKSVQGEFINGDPAGPWAYWKPDGHLYQKADFSETDQAIVLTPEFDDPDATEFPADDDERSAELKTPNTRVVR